MALHVRVLGPLEFEVDGRAVLPGSTREAGVAATLAVLGDGRSVTPGAVAAALWGDDLPGTSRKTLQAYVSRLRKRGVPITTDAVGYRLGEPGGVRVDADEFTAGVERARNALLDWRHQAARSKYLDALGLWRGAALAGLDHLPGLAPVAARLSELRLDATEDLLDAELGLGENVLGRVLELVVQHPYRERLWGHLMVALYRAGRQAEALDAFQRCRRTLIEDLGVEPGHALRDLERRILEHDPSLGIAPQGTAGRKGVVTIFATDIEGSTASWERDEEAMRVDLASHDRILTDVVVASGGTVWKSTGDGLYAVFAMPSAAVVAAVTAQQRLAGHAWRGSALHARIVVVTGVAEPRDSDWFGPAVNRAARHLDAAHGGQVLLSASTVELLGNELGVGVELRYLGTHRFRGLPEERIHDLVIPGIPLPPNILRVSGPQLRVPVPRTSFVGEQRVVDDIGAALTRTPLVTLTGVGGCGKTRLATEVARAVVDRYADGVYLVELASVTDARSLVGALASGTETPTAATVGSSSGPVIDAVIAHLAGRDALLLVDNCEHVLDAAADAVTRILDRCPRVAVLATSREAMGAAGEIAIQVKSLDTTDERGPSAARLFLERAADADPTFEPSDDDLIAVVELCRRLDGLPLAIELAAALAPTMTPSELLARIDDRFALLLGGRRRVGRQQTLQATLDWSWALLDEDAQGVLARMSVAPGTWRLDALEEITDASPAVLQRLVRSSLVTAVRGDDGTRYRLLETIRLYAEAKLAERADADEARDRHRDWWLSRGEAMAFERALFDDAVAETLHVDLAHLRAALEWSSADGRLDLAARLVVATAGVWGNRARTEGADWLGRSINASGLGAAERARAIVVLEFFDMSSRGLGDPDALLAEAIDALNPDDGFVLLGYALRSVWWSIISGRTRDDDDVARYRLFLGRAEREDAPAAWRAASDLVTGWCRLGQVATHTAAVDVLERGERTVPAWSPMLQAQIASVLAIGYHLVGRDEDAATALERALAARPLHLSADADDVALRAIAVIRATQGRLTEAQATVLWLMEHGPWFDRPSFVGDLVVLMAVIAIIAGEHERGALLLAGATQMSGVVFGSPATYGLYWKYRPIVQAALGPRAREVRDRGRQMTRDECLALARTPLAHR